MSRELYTAYSGASLAWRQLEVVANNVANANTPGFREARMVFQLAPGGNPDSPLDSAFAEIAGMSYNSQDGTLVQDNVQTHLAVRGDAFFALTSAGSVSSACATPHRSAETAGPASRPPPRTSP
jgi:flagellar basal-body rod protein FlgF